MPDLFTTDLTSRPSRRVFKAQAHCLCSGRVAPRSRFHCKYSRL